MNTTAVTTGVTAAGITPAPSRGETDPPGEVIMRARGLEMSFGQTHALRGVDLDLLAGEVLAVTGRPFSATLPRYEDLVPTVHLALRPERAALNARIDARARAIFDAGLIEEARELIGQGLAEGTTAPRAIGYAQALAVLDGTMSREEAVEATAAATRKLASRQIKWFRRDPRVHWIDVALEPGGDWAPGERERVTRRALELVRAGERSAPRR